jgi:DNA polymerase sigma
MRGNFGPHVADRIRESTTEFLSNEKTPPERGELAATQVKELIETIANEQLGLRGEVHLFGSFSNGFRTGSSDVDVVFVGDLGSETPASVLNAFIMHTTDYGFIHVTKIFQANVPLIKMTHAESNIEVDLCINNRLGVRNSYLLLSYCCYESRLADLGRLVKAFAKSRDLVGTADGCLNSYAYMLLVITYGLYVNLVPNLQLLAHEPVYIDRWDVKFLEDLSILPPSTCELSLPELIVGFFHFYAFEFDWEKFAVCMRLFDGSSPVDKFSLMTPTSADQWYIEDPFDLKHNLGGKCSVNGKKTYSWGVSGRRAYVAEHGQLE